MTDLPYRAVVQAILLGIEQSNKCSIDFNRVGFQYVTRYVRLNTILMINGIFSHHYVYNNVNIFNLEDMQIYYNSL